MTEEEFRASVIQAGVPEAQANALNKQGFPDFMIMAFLQVVESLKNHKLKADPGVPEVLGAPERAPRDLIVSSRLPGGVGTDLIEANYDLKGFQIKAKSCDWGPMAGFICQLPFLNKEGYGKIAYNTGYIADYLGSIDAFGDTKAQINKLEVALQQMRTLLMPVSIAVPSIQPTVFSDLYDALKYLKAFVDGQATVHYSQGILTSEELTTINTLTSYDAYEKCQEPQEWQQDEFARIRSQIYKVYNLKEQALRVTYRNKEHTNAAWSGENTIPDVPNAPFIPLKRRFVATATSPVLDQVKQLNGVLDAVAGEADIITGTAVNNSDKPLADREGLSTIKVEFVLRKEPLPNEPDLWGIYYKKIYYRSEPGGPFVASNPSAYTNAPLGGAQATTVGLDAKIRKKKKTESLDAYVLYVEARKATFDRIYTNSEVKVGAETCYPVQGIMNPHPPYKVPTEAGFYKNAVSGDFDLFAFWPSDNIPASDLVRLSESHMGCSLKYYPQVDTRVCLEFIPGFDELTDENKGNLKESAEEGNIHNVGRQVAVSLNSTANLIWAKRYGGKAGGKLSLDKAFHSDEGGRPEVMEVEFPIAFFLPKALPAPKTLPGQAPQPAPLLGARGGLVANPTEFVALMQASADAGYHVMMHSEWMIHFFYISQPQPVKDAFRAKLTEKKQKAFTDIDAHHAKMYTATAENPGLVPFAQQAFEDALVALLNLPLDTFNRLRDKILALASLGDTRAIERNNSVRLVVAGMPEAPAAAPAGVPAAPAGA